MNLLKSFFKKNNNKLSEYFSQSVINVIDFVDTISSDLEDEQFYEFIFNNTNNEFEANEIYIFLPIAFAQLWLPNVNWEAEYIELINKKEVSKRYDETESFKKIIIESKKYFKNKPLQNTIMQIGGRSAEINAINKLLLDGGKIEDIKLTKSIIIR